MPGLHELEKSISADIAADPLSTKTNYLFTPVDKRAFGVAIGVVSALVLGGLTIVDVIASDPLPALDLLREYFAGYSLSPLGALIGGAWGFAVGFCAGWFIAFTRNFVLAVSLFFLRSRADLDDASDFLDHI